ncbi:peptidase domain-containing ABC transporter [Herpetosiphon llansteffanensis]|uniref:peptidase domain-containing ABC transporter n=1 Tax=Herpetosiphon llansteffanensis TaxID=2094568 RepID=UPI0013E031E2|nr:peptidase domain-containing ABC transporter [Herpetosiphon llansteffanensis]
MLNKTLIYRRLPWIRASEGRDCGPSVFASVAHFYKHRITLEQARTLVGADRNGTSLAGLRDGGRAIGLESRPAQAIYSALQHVQLPAIAHLKGGEGHYVVIYKWSPTSVVVLDPSRGLRTLSKTEFEAMWSGYLVEFKPTAALKPREIEVKPLKTLFQLARQHKLILGIVLFFALLATSLGWITSFFMQILIDSILPNRDQALLFALGVGLILVSVFQSALQFGRLWLSARVGQRVHQSYSAQYIDRLLRLPMKVFDVRCIPGLVLRVTQADGIQLALSEGLITILADTAMFVTALGIIAFYNPVAALIAAAALPLVWFVLFSLNDRVYNVQLSSIIHMEEFTSHMVDVFDCIRTIKVFGAEEQYKTLLNEKLANFTKSRMDSRINIALPSAWSVLATSLITASILWYGSSQVFAGSMTPGELVVLFGMVAFYLQPIQRLPATILNLRTALLGIERMDEIMTLPDEESRANDVVALPEVKGEIKFNDVHFAYLRNKMVLKKLNFEIKPGETVAIVGETGSGKTSLANLIAGFYLPSHGDVLIDGISTRQIKPDELRNAISAVFQNTRLMQQSIRDNITLMRDTDMELIRNAAKIAQADEFISGQMYGYESQVARGGDNFSSGQGQRITLARALLKNAPILILDEATSNLDSATEQGFLQALEENRAGRTTVVIAHRLSTILRADRILVMDAGEIIESGSHEQLLAQAGHYYNLIKGQLTKPISEPIEQIAATNLNQRTA